MNSKHVGKHSEKTLSMYCSVAKFCPTLCDLVACSRPGLPVLHYPITSLLKLMSIVSVMPSNHLILCCPLLLLPSVFPSIGVFSDESALGEEKFTQNMHLTTKNVQIVKYRNYIF